MQVMPSGDVSWVALKEDGPGHESPGGGGGGRRAYPNLAEEGRAIQGDGLGAS